MKCLYIILFTFLFSLSSFGKSAIVSQREYIVTTHQMHDEILTFGLNTCVALVLYSRDSKKAFLAHFDATVDVEKELPKLIRDFDNNISKTYVVGGIPASTIKIFDRVVRTLETLNIEITDARKNKLDNHAINLGLDLFNGEINFSPSHSLIEDYSVMKAKADRLKFSSGRMFRHIESIGGGDYIPISTNDDGLFRPF